MSAAEVLYGASATATVTMDDTNLRYLAGIPQSASGTSWNLGKLSGACFFATSSGGTALDVRATCVAQGWNQSGPVWFQLNGNTYSGSTGSASCTISGNFPNGIIFQVNSGVYLVGKGGAGANGVAQDGAVGAVAGSVGGAGLAVTSYTGGTIYINNLGFIGGGGGGGGRGGYLTYSSGYSFGNYGQAAGGGGAGFGAGGTAAQYASSSGAAGTINAGGIGGSDYFYATRGGTGGALGTAGGTGGLNSGASFGGAAGVATSGTVASGKVVWIATGTRYGTVG